MFFFGFFLFFFCFFCFFQAEDGIRDLVRSRGLGDVYKRQAQALGLLDHVLDLGLRLFARARGQKRRVDPEVVADRIEAPRLPGGLDGVDEDPVLSLIHI